MSMYLVGYLIYEGDGVKRVASNCDLKAGVHSGVPARTKGKLKEKVVSHMKMLQKTLERVASYFKNQHIKYAA